MEQVDEGILMLAHEIKPILYPLKANLGSALIEVSSHYKSLLLTRCFQWTQWCSSNWCHRLTHTLSLHEWITPVLVLCQDVAQGHSHSSTPSRHIFWSCFRREWKRTPRLTIVNDKLLRNQPIMTKCTLLRISHIPLIAMLESINMLLMIKYYLMYAESHSKWKLNGQFSVSSLCIGSEAFLQRIRIDSKAVVQQNAAAARR